MICIICLQILKILSTLNLNHQASKNISPHLGPSGSLSHAITLNQANHFLVQERYADAATAFQALKEKNPGTRVYDIGLEMALRAMARQSCDPMHETAIHPASHTPDATGPRLFCVVTAVRNGEPFLAEAMESVLSQEGYFFIDYFVKDAESTDGTLQTLRAMAHRIESGLFPIRCLGIRFRFESSPDKGLYDGVAMALSQTPWASAPGNILSYINADDYFHSGAFAVVAHVFDELPAQWICGQVNTVSETKELICTPEFPLTYSREDILAGHHAGEGLYFIQQEGNFWLRSLYESCGPLDSTCRLAGDFDLWHRFAEKTEPLALDRPLASFRYRAGQLSEGMDRYQSEVERVLASGRPSGTSTAAPAVAPHFFPSRKAPRKGIQQKPGALCFLTPEGRVREVAYVKRGWYCW